MNKLGQNRESGSPNEFVLILEKGFELNLKLGLYQKKIPALSLSPRGNSAIVSSVASSSKGEITRVRDKCP